MLDLKKAHNHSFKNADEVNASELCGCFCCIRTYPPAEIKKWAQEKPDGRTAICPYCSVDSVIGDASGYALTEDFLREMYEYWFEREVPREELNNGNKKMV